MQAVEPKVRRWSREEYYRMGEMGWFKDQRVELIDGEVIQMSPHRGPHAMAIGLIGTALQQAFGSGFWIRVQLPLSVGPNSDPEPDFAVVPGSPRDYPEHPAGALLVVEASDTTLPFDSGDKASLYARAEIADYWIVDLVHDELIVHRGPTADASARFGYRYDSVRRFSSADTIAPLACPAARITVADLLP